MCKSDHYQVKSEDIFMSFILSKILFLFKILISTDVNCQVIHQSGEVSTLA